MATTRVTFGAVLGAISTTANTVTNSLQAVNDSVGMLNKTIGLAAHKQEVNHGIEKMLFAKNRHQEAAQELAESRFAVKKYMAQSQDHTDLYKAAYEELAVLFTKQ